RRRHTRFSRDWSSDVCSSDLAKVDHLPCGDADHGSLLDEAFEQTRGGFPLPHFEGKDPQTGMEAQAVEIGVEQPLHRWRSVELQIGRASCRERVWMSLGDVT